MVLAPVVQLDPERATFADMLDRYAISLRSRGFSDIPIIALTANSRDEDKQECRAAGMSDFLTKPIRYEDLHNCLSRWI